MLNSTPTSLSKSSRRATRTILIREAAICRANSLPIPDEAPVTSAQGPNLSLSSAALITLLRSAYVGLVVSSDHLVHNRLEVSRLTKCNAHFCSARFGLRRVGPRV